MHRIAALPIALAAVLLAGCTASSPQTDGKGGGADAAPIELSIGVSIPAADHGWTAGVVWWAERAADLYPQIDWRIQTALTPEKQIADIETMMAQGVDALVVLATESAPLTPIAKKVHERGIYLVSVDRGFLEPVADLFVEGDNEAFGRKSAQYLVDQLGGDGRIVILEGIPSTVNTARVEAAEAVFAQHPDIDILGRQTGMWNREKAYQVMQAFLTQFDQIDAVWASDDDMAEGVEQAIVEAGRQDEMWILGGAGKKQIVKRVMDGDPLYPADITYPPSMIAVGIHMAVSNLRDGSRQAIGAFMPRHIKLDVELITPENAERFYFPESAF